MNLTYAVQPSPDGLAQAFIIGANFIGNESVAMVLGDNIFAGHGLKKRLNAAVEKAENGKGATVFGYYVDDPRTVRPFLSRKSQNIRRATTVSPVCTSMITVWSSLLRT